MFRTIINGLLVRGLAGALLVGGIWAPAVAAGKPLAQFANGEVVTENDFSAYVDRRADLKPLARNVWGVENALREMVLTRLLVLEGQRLKQTSRSGDKNERFDDEYALAVYQQLVNTCEKPKTESGARAFYDQHPEAFTAPASARLARIMLPASERVDGAPAMAWLMEQAKSVQMGSKTFDQVAAAAHGHYKLEAQGDLGWVNLTGDVTIMRALASAKAGEMVGPVRDGDFAYLFLVGEKRESSVFKWEDVKSSAASRQMTYCREQANKELTEKLYKQYGVVINNDAIKSMFRRPAAQRSVPNSTQRVKKGEVSLAPAVPYVGVSLAATRITS